MAQITYANKVALNENPEIANINKVTDDDMNEIKQVVNDNYNNTIQITDTEPTDSDNKIWIDTGEVGSAVSEITNEYSTSTGLGYSANYVNNLIKFEKIGNDLTGTGTLNLSKPITDYTFILVITFGGTRSAKTSVLIPTELATTYNASDDFSGSAIQSTSVFYQTEFYFSNSTTINITGASHSGWPNAGIKAVYGIKI